MLSLRMSDRLMLSFSPPVYDAEMSEYLFVSPANSPPLFTSIIITTITTTTAADAASTTAIATHHRHHHHHHSRHPSPTPPQSPSITDTITNRHPRTMNHAVNSINAAFCKKSYVRYGIKYGTACSTLFHTCTEVSRADGPKHEP